MGQNPYSHLRFSVNEGALKDPEATTKIVWFFEMQAYGVELDPKTASNTVVWPSAMAARLASDASDSA